jgi:2,3-bisphosphoglycerate-dependent phosphoglycerate mutase
MSKLILMRHGQSQWNLEDKFAGFANPLLTPLGEEQAQQAGEKFKALGIMPQIIFTSTLQRAWRTAEIIHESLSPKTDLPIIRSDDLRERDYGELTGINREEAKVKFGEEQVRIWRRSYSDGAPGGESLENVVTRARPYFEEHILPLLLRGEDAAIVSHGNTTRALLVVLGLETPKSIEKVEIPIGIPYVVKFDGGKATGYQST